MFYLGSIAGFLPYILALSLTILWGGHAGMPFLTSNIAPESKTEILTEHKISIENPIKFRTYNQVIAEEVTEFSALFCTYTKLFNLKPLRLHYSTELGISLLRAPPVSLF